jgi:hypothetical protein
MKRGMQMVRARKKPSRPICNSAGSSLAAASTGPLRLPVRRPDLQSDDEKRVRQLVALRTVTLKIGEPQRVFREMFLKPPIHPSSSSDVKVALCPALWLARTDIGANPKTARIEKKRAPSTLSNLLFLRYSADTEVTRH